jgi:arginase family enzyme
MPVCFPEPDGLSIEETLAFLSTSIRSKRFTGISVSCYHPNLDSNLKAASMVMGMLGSILSSGE